jgi:hypothetical protein
MHGGGKRASAIIQQINTWQPRIVALAEFRATPASRTIADGLLQLGYTHQLTTATPQHPARNGLLLASSIPLRRVYLRPAPNHHIAGSWLKLIQNPKSTLP